MLAEANLLAASARLAHAAGRRRPVALDRLAGGKNNRVYRVTLDDDGCAVLKSYYTDPRDPRDRLGAEWSFLSYAWQRDVRSLPEPLACEPETGIALYGFLPGRKLRPGEVEARHVTAAVEFVRAINAAPREPLALAPGSEACFTLAMHVAAVERRVARLGRLDPEAPQHLAAQAFVERRLQPVWSAVKARIDTASKAMGLSPDIELSLAETCISPSDFGFHNALVDGDTIGFIDFEYAGRDDAAKLVGDFFCQPEVPVPIAHYDDFVAGLASGLGLGETAQARCALLLDAYRVKWVCIVLNDFLPMDSARRAFAESGSRAERCTAQLAKAGQQLELVRAA